MIYRFFPGFAPKVCKFKKKVSNLLPGHTSRRHRQSTEKINENRLTMNRKKSGGIVYSTNPDFRIPEDEEAVSLPPDRQQLYVWLESKGRGGKTVSLVKGFNGKNNDLEDLAKALKGLCGTGGSVKDGEILIQGDFRDKIMAWLSSRGYKVKKAGG
jgi:translation initiation factor 1